QGLTADIVEASDKGFQFYGAHVCLVLPQEITPANGCSYGRRLSRSARALDKGFCDLTTRDVRENRHRHRHRLGVIPGINGKLNSVTIYEGPHTSSWEVPPGARILTLCRETT